MSSRTVNRTTTARRLPYKPIAIGLAAVALFAGLLVYAVAQASALKPAPDFRLPALSGGTVSLSEYQGKKNVLLFYNMGIGCQACLQQIVDLENDRRYAEMDLALLPIMVNPLPELKKELEEQGIDPNSPVLSDRSKSTCAAYRVDCQMHGGNPGHVFVLVDKGGKIRWEKDYGGRMYVEPDELFSELARRR